MNERVKTRLWHFIGLSWLIWHVLSLAAWAQQPPSSSAVIPAVPADYALVEGDIIMPKQVLQALRQAERLGVAAAPQANYGGRLWPNNGLVLYQFQTVCAPTSTCTNAPPSGCVSAARQAIMRAAMNVVEDASAVQFRQCTGNSCPNNFNFLNIRDTTNDTMPTSATDNTCQSTAANSSSVGMVGNTGQNLNIVSWTGASAQWVIIHELLHALGMYHEQARVDRNTFVDVTTLCANIQGGCLNNTIFNNDFARQRGIDYGPYDFESLMQYDQCAFSRNSNCPTTSPAFPDGGVTIRVQAPYNTQFATDGVTLLPAALGQGSNPNRLTELDRLTVSFLYPEPNWRFVGNPFSFPQTFLVQTGAFLTPYETLDTAVAATPVGGVIWLQPGTYTLREALSKRVTLRAPLGGVTIRQGAAAPSGSTLASVSAASYEGELAANSIAAAFGVNLAASTAIASSLPLPTTLAGATVKVTDREQVTRDAPLFFVSPAQINYLIPANSKPGLSKITVYNGDRVVATSEVPVNPVAPALFTANATGQGVPAAALFRLRADGSQSYEDVSRYDAAQQRFVPVPIDLGPEGDQVFLILFGTGFRTRTALEAVTAFINGEIAEVLYAGVAPGFAGLDQANVRIPRTLAGQGEVSLALSADYRSTNAVTINVR